MIRMVLIIIISIMLSGCASPGVAFKEYDDKIEIVAKNADGFLSALFGARLPAGDYECEFGEHKKASFSTKTDLKLLDLNLSKLGE